MPNKAESRKNFFRDHVIVHTYIRNYLPTLCNMLFSTVLFLAGLVGLANAHFQLQFPSPRGKFDEDNEPKFCDGYDTASKNRTQFPLSGGFFTLNSEHAKWTSGVLLSTAQNPTSFDGFSQLVPFFQLEGEGVFCIPLNLASAPSVQEGSNVTIQIVFDGGDGNLYQCADLTLSKSASISGVTCSNATGTSTSSAAAGGSSATSPAAATATTSPKPSGGAIGRAVSMGYLGAVAGVILLTL
jgi:hypothetical protein